jgi:hypothetical protein
MLHLKQKICKCGKKAMQNRKKCYSCILAAQRIKRMASIATKQARRAKRKEKLSNSPRQLKKKAWGLISRFVRTQGMSKSGFNNCYTCGVVKSYKELQCGHLFHGRLDLDVRNLRPQCPRCNIFLNGNGAVFALKMTEEIGIKGMKDLLLLANTKGNNYSLAELHEIIEKYS